MTTFRTGHQLETHSMIVRLAVSERRVGQWEESVRSDLQRMRWSHGPVRAHRRDILRISIRALREAKDWAAAKDADLRLHLGVTR